MLRRKVLCNICVGLLRNICAKKYSSVSRDLETNNWINLIHAGTSSRFYIFLFFGSTVLRFLYFPVNLLVSLLPIPLLQL